MFIDKRIINQWSCIATAQKYAVAMQLTDFFNNSSYKHLAPPELKPLCQQNLVNFSKILGDSTISLTYFSRNNLP